jgi:HK97 family phage major capsid protein
MDPKEMAALFSRGAKFGVTAEEVQKILDDGKGRAELDALIVERQAAEAAQLKKEIEERKAQKPARPAGVTEEAAIGAPAIVKNDRKYSLANVCRSLAGEQVDIGFEREMSQECGRIRGKAPKGMIIPFNALSRRDLSVSGTSSATVATLLDSSNFIDLLRTKYVIGQAGVTFLPGVVGNLSIPKMSAGATAYHVAEGSDVTESTPTLANVTGSPHTIGAIVDVTRRMLEQSTPAVESMIRREIEERLMRGVQIAVFAGTGSDGQPSAITTATGINNPSINSAGTPTYAEILNFPGSIMADNAEADGQKWIMTAEVWAKLAATMRTATYGDIPVLDPVSKSCVGFPYLTTEDVPANSAWFGDWSTVVIPFWGAGVEIAADNAKLFASGGLTLRALLDYDVMVRNGAALAYNSAVTA